MKIIRIISGGQTGVDRAGLDFAIESNIPHGGYCPKERKAEDGTIKSKYNLIETSSLEYSERTERNLTESDGTLIIYLDKMTGGTLLTAELCRTKKKPSFVVNLRNLLEFSRQEFIAWLKDNNIKTLNIAGSRESIAPIYSKAKNFLHRFFESIA